VWSKLCVGIPHAQRYSVSRERFDFLDMEYKWKLYSTVLVVT
jgi:hypothetical protein